MSNKALMMIKLH